MMGDFYELLGVERDASPEEIKRAFRRLARQYHPDVAGDDPETETRFKEIARAYETLSDPERRARYDRFGEEGMGAGADPFVGVNLSDLFDAFFGGDPFNVRGDAQARRGPDAEVKLDLAFADAVFGAEKTIDLRLPVECDTCDASGCAPGTHPETCGDCGGVGEVREVRRSILGQIVSARPCPRCRGVGRMITSPCEECGGEGRVTRSRSLQVEVPAGIADGQRLRLGGRGPVGPRGTPPGDLYVDISVAPHDDYERVGDDLVRRLEVAVTQAMLGAHISIETLEGEHEDLVVPPGTRDGAVFRLKGRGVPHLGRSGRGDLLVEVRVAIPDSLSDEEDELVRRLAELRGDDVAPRDRRLFSKIRSAFQ